MAKRKLVDAPSLTDVYESTQAALHNIKSMALVAQRGCLTLNGYELEEHLSVMFAMAQNAAITLDENSTLFGFKGAANG